MRRLAVLALVAAVSACSAILGFDHGFLRDGGSEDDGGAPPAEAGADAEQQDGCGAAEKTCSGMCVSVVDTNYGCTSTGCTACPGVAHGDGICDAGACGVKCTAPFVDCNGRVDDGCEIDPTNGDPANCGACSRACDAGLLCNPGGTCATTCSSGTNCDGGCVDTTKNPSHCGGCNVRCVPGANATASCVDSGCTYTCDPNWANCGGNGDACTTNIATDESNCGGCGHACMAGANASVTGCNGGKCAFTCNLFYKDCNGDLADGGDCECNTGLLGTVCLSDGTCGMCRSAGGSCGASSDCCVGNADTCGANKKCCMAKFKPCNSTNEGDCCSGLCDTSKGMCL